MKKTTHKSIEEMNRLDVIEALRSYAHPSWYHKLIDSRNSTSGLKSLLMYYKQSADEKVKSLQMISHVIRVADIKII